MRCAHVLGIHTSGQPKPARNATVAASLVVMPQATSEALGTFVLRAKEDPKRLWRRSEASRRTRRVILVMARVAPPAGTRARRAGRAREGPGHVPDEWDRPSRPPWRALTRGGHAQKRT